MLMVRGRVKPGSVAEVESAVADPFRQIDEAQPDGVRYASTKAEDGETFVALVCGAG